VSKEGSGLPGRLEQPLTPAEFDQFARFAVESFSDPTYLLAQAGDIIYANQAATALLGFTREELCAKQMYEINVDLDPSNWGAIWALLQASGQRMFEARHRHKDGRVLPVRVSAHLFRIGEREYSCAIIHDIRERRQLEGRLQQAEKMEAVGRLAGGVAHDFNNQLAGILGYAELAQLAVEPDSPAVALLEELIAGVKVAASLTAQLLAFSRQGKFVSEPVDLHRLTQHVLSMFSRSVQRNIQVVCALEAARHWTLGDASQLQSAVLNLLLNARDAMPEGGTIRVDSFNMDFAPSEDTPPPHGLAAGPYVVLRVLDTGVGIDPALGERVFEPFFTTKETGAGTGLGLAAVYGTLKNHKGAVAVDSVLGKGSVFTLYLPVSRRESAASSERSRSGEPHGLRLSGHVLVVDDEPAIRDTTGQMLEALGCTVSVCADGESALAYFEREHAKVELVLLDLVMPGKSGAETFAALKRIDPHVQVLLVSGYSEEGHAQALVDAGARGFLQKPFTMASLAARVREILAR
jgi:PAS domain S-box-containing protein